MAERDVVVDKLKLQYEGLFSVAELYSLIDNWFGQKYYDKRENRNSEIVKPDGKYIEVELEPWKKVTDYTRFVIKVRFSIHKLKDVIVEKDHHKVKLNHGKINFTFDAYLDTDYEGKWEGKPVYFFLRMVFDKYVYKPFTVAYSSGVAGDLMDLHNQIKAYLNLHRFM